MNFSEQVSSFTAQFLFVLFPNIEIAPQKGAITTTYFDLYR